MICTSTPLRVPNSSLNTSLCSLKMLSRVCSSRASVLSSPKLMGNSDIQLRPSRFAPLFTTISGNFFCSLLCFTSTFTSPIMSTLSPLYCLRARGGGFNSGKLPPHRLLHVCSFTMDTGLPVSNSSSTLVSQMFKVINMGGAFDLRWYIVSTGRSPSCSSTISK